jgi:hypothetical protein
MASTVGNKMFFSKPQENVLSQQQPTLDQPHQTGFSALISKQSITVNVRNQSLDRTSVVYQ